MKYDIICADPCWTFSDKLLMSDVKRGAESQYSVLTTDEIKKLNVKNIVADDAVLALWVPSSIIQDGLDTMKAWGFRYVQSHIWIKIKNKPFENISKQMRKASRNKLNIEDTVNNIIESFNFNSMLMMGMGRTFRNVHEICLIGVRGKIYSKLKNKSQRSVHFDINKKHSAKPEKLQEMLELMFPDENLKKLEMFARRVRPDWVCVGWESPDSLNEDIRDSIIRLSNL